MSARNRRLVLSARARVDLSDILLLTDRRWGRRQMQAYNRVLTEAFAELAKYPRLGRSRLDYGPSFHSYLVRQHVIIYQLIDAEIIVARILHVRRDAASEFETTTEE